ncbi:baeRF3 domain-containing protein [Ottowia beijingensis]|uniref:baeRF3 domain-containing protein n=1 Tax=Ottowia beijingensis TaxID=1207057 RepID=UPI00280646C8|nr:hypothetical protein [Ottowia beijingensis]
MANLSNDYPARILGTHEAPCLSLYQPTHRQFPDRQQDPIRFRNLVKQLETSLQQKYADRDIAPLLAPFNALADDAEFWNHGAEGLAVLGAADMFGVYRLQRPVEELAIVADSFHTKPLMRIVQSADRYQILALSRHSARLFEGNRDRVDEIALAPEVPRDLDDLAMREAQRDRASRTHGRVEPGVMGRHGASDVKQDGIEGDTEKFFREVDRAVLEHHSRPSGWPLLLAALPEHHHLLRQVSTNPHLMDASLDVDASQLSLDELRERAWAVVQPRYLERLAGLIDALRPPRPGSKAAPICPTWPAPRPRGVSPPCCWRPTATSPGASTPTPARWSRPGWTIRGSTTCWTTWASGCCAAAAKW